MRLCAVEGIELLLLGPADYSATAGHRGQWEGPGVAAQLLAIKDAIRRAGKHCGLITTSRENLIERRSQGFRMLGVGLDAGLLVRSLHDCLGAVGRDRAISADLAAPPLTARPLPCRRRLPTCAPIEPKS